MSEIFKFLRQTDLERRKGFHPPDTELTPLDIPLQDSTPGKTLAAESELTLLEPVAPELEAGSAGTFDLSAAENKLRKVLDPRNIFGEQFRMLRTKLALMQKQKGVKTILVTSAVPREGKTLVASGLAGVIAQEPGKNVVLLDADMRKPGSGSTIGLNGNSYGGLSRILTGEIGFSESLLRSTNLEFYFMPSGPLPINPSELLGTSSLESILKKAADSFDWVIVDSPPVLAITDSTLIAPLCDTVILVVRANSTPSKLVIEAIERIGRERICGIIFNRQPHISSSAYYYEYYYRSGSKQPKKSNPAPDGPHS
jgi:protein-tyrosine kinase